jgi:hypothetical protein
MEGHLIRRKASNFAAGLILAISLPALLLTCSANARAQTGGGFTNILPKASIVSDGSVAARDPDSPADEGVPPAVSTAPPGHTLHHHPAVAEPWYSAAVEPTHAMLKLKSDTWIYAGPETSSRTLEHVGAGKFLNVTGSTHYFVQVKLKNGATGYVPLSAIELTRPQDKIMRLSTDSAVLSQPNRYGKKLSEVHLGHDVHVIGVSMNYVKIRMKSGLEGYIPMTAAE